MAAANPFDGSAAQLVPQAVEKLPLHRWRPGSRLLVIGSRDGASPAPDLERAEARSFRRPLTPELVTAAQDAAATAGIALAWSTTLLFPDAVATCLAARHGALVVASSGHGDAALAERLLATADAWQLVLGPQPGPLAGRILAGARHVEVLALWRDPARPLPALDLALAKAVHLAPATQADASEDGMAAAWTAARAALPPELPLYDEVHRRDTCACGETLVWRSAGRSRLDALGTDARCRSCGRAHAFTLEPAARDLP